MIEQAWSFAENKEQERRLTPVGVVVLNMRGCGGGFVVAKVKPPKSLFCSRRKWRLSFVKPPTKCQDSF